jgi:D-alanine-D-alanine ligase
MHPTLPSSLRIGVLRGGPSPEYDVSLKTGGHVLEQLSKTHQPFDIFISKDGTWHMHGIPRSPDRILKHLDVVWNGLHGAYGEDGTVQGILSQFGIPFTGSDRFSSAIAMNKALAKERLAAAGAKVPVHAIVREGEDASSRSREIFSSLPHPFVVKPVRGGSSVGVSIVRTPAELVQSIQDIHASGSAAIVEEYIEGREATCGVVDSFRGKDIYALPVVEIIAPQHKEFFDYEAKYGGQSREVCPSGFSDADKKEMERVAALAHKTLGLRHYSRSDFIIHPRRGIYFLETNSLPGLTSESLLPKSLAAVGVSSSEFIHHVLRMALEKR